MTEAPPSTEISPRWLGIFRLEIPLCAVTVAYWLLAPDHYLERMFGSAGVDASERYLLWQAGSAVLSMFVWFYGRVLFSRTVHLRTFRFLQEGMTIGDLGVLALSAYLAVVGRPDTGMLVSQVVLAAFWGCLRVVFLLQHRPKAWR